MDFTPGLHLRSQVCTTEAIVIRSPSGGTTLSLTCGGAPMVPKDAEVPDGAAPAVGLNTGNELGKRYTAVADDGFEVLVTKPGAGTLADGTEPLVLKQARPLPSSD